MKKVYRYFIDIFEESSTGCANEIVVNSKFTSGIFAENFHNLGKVCKPQVLYPAIQIPDINAATTGKESIQYAEGYDFIFASLNRYERKKNIPLAIHAFHLLLQDIKKNTGAKEKYRVLLVIAGGYDERVAENVEHFEELVSLVNECGDDVSCNTIFRRSISDAERNALLTCATAILYTPSNEHFGIVPLEAMCRETPVIAVSSGGPLESVVHEKTGFLCDESAQSFADAMLKLILDDTLTIQMGRSARVHTKQKFSFEAMVAQLECGLQSAVQCKGKTRPREEDFLFSLIKFFSISLFLIVAIIVGIVYHIRVI